MQNTFWTVSRRRCHWSKHKEGTTVMKIVVTGGSGFIGSHIVDELITQGHEVVIYDLDAPRYEQACAFIRGDIRDVDRMTNVAKGKDAIYNIAAEANVNRFSESPLFSNEITSHGTLSVLEAAHRAGTPRVLLASTEWVYGSVPDIGNENVTEEAPYTDSPDHIYTSSKIASELFCKNYLRFHGIHYTIMRYGIPFGERARPETVTPIFLRRLLKDEPITIHGDGSQSRQFIYVKDLARGNVACLQPAGVDAIYNINGRERISVLQIVQTLEEILGKKARITFVEDRQGNFRGRFISSEKAKKLLGWEVKLGYKEAMALYVDWFLRTQGT
jgi:UDP-glucose 4-epimerase